MDFDQAFGPHLDPLWNLALRLSDSRQDAEDLLQDTCLAGWRAWDRHGPPDQPRAWLVTICLNLARARWRTARPRPVDCLAPELQQVVAEQALWHRTVRDVDAEAMANLEASEVHTQLRKLPTAQREAIVLMDLCGFTAAQSALLLDVPRNTVLSRVHRGHQALALLLADWRPTP